MLKRRELLYAGLLALPSYFLSEPAMAKPKTAILSQQAIFARAKQELPADFYFLYRIIERMARANGLDDTPWRIQISEKYDINAFATQVNLIVVDQGMLDQVANDKAAIGFVVGHEIGHHIKHHIALSAAQRELKINQVQKEIELSVQAEAEKAEGEAAKVAAMNAVTGIACQLFRQCATLPIGLAVLLAADGKRDPTKVKQRTDELVAKKKAELEASQSASSRANELEADEAGYIYTATTGLDVMGTLRVMEVLNRTPGAELDSDHPAVPSRIAALKKLMVERPSGALADSRKARLQATKPLTYSLSKDKVSLRINSRFQESKKDDLNF